MKAVVLREESAENAARLLAEACGEHQVQPQILTLHSDNGSPMKGSTMLATMQALGVVPSFSRPSVSNDNPYSEALFRTLKYVPSYPRKPFDPSMPRGRGSSASSPGTTASTGTAASVSSPPTSATKGTTSASCSRVATSTRLRDDGTLPDGVGTRGSGTRPPPCPSTFAIGRPALGRRRRSASERLRRRAWCRRTLEDVDRAAPAPRRIDVTRMTSGGIYLDAHRRRGGGSGGVTARHGRRDAEGEEASNPIVVADGVGDHEAQLA